MKDATNCATPACQISFTSYVRCLICRSVQDSRVLSGFAQIPIKDPACPTTSTVTLNQPCATGRECSTVWTTVLSTPTACGTGSVTSGPVVSTTVTKSTKTTTTTKSTPTGPIPDDACLPQPISDNLYGITVDPASAFTGSAAIAGVANDAVTPIGYKLIFRNRLASVSADKFLGVRTLGSYDPFTCADYCDKTTGCSAFNIFFERDPTLDPGEYCPDPPGTPNIKCTLWGVLLDSTMATNTGQGR